MVVKEKEEKSGHIKGRRCVVDFVTSRNALGDDEGPDSFLGPNRLYNYGFQVLRWSKETIL